MSDAINALANMLYCQALNVHLEGMHVSRDAFDRLDILAVNAGADLPRLTWRDALLKDASRVWMADDASDRAALDAHRQEVHEAQHPDIVKLSEDAWYDMHPED